MGCGEYLQEALCDDSELDVAMVGCDLASDGVSVSIRDLRCRYWFPLTRLMGVMAAIQKW